MTKYNILHSIAIPTALSAVGFSFVGFTGVSHLVMQTGSADFTGVSECFPICPSEPIGPGVWM